MKPAHTAATASVPPAQLRARRIGPPFWLVALASVVALPVLAWLSAYFWLNSTPGRAMVTETLRDAVKSDRVQVADVRYGPGPDTLRLLDLQITDGQNTPLISAQLVHAELDLGALLAGRYAVDALAAHDFDLLLAWDDEGKLNVAKAFAKPKDPTEPPKPKSPPATFAIPTIALSHGTVRLEGPRWGLRFADVNAAGQISAGPDTGLRIAADLTGGPADARFGKKPDVVAFDQVMIKAFHWAGTGFEVARLQLVRPEAAGVDVGGSMSFDEVPGATLTGTASVDAALTELALPGMLPEGARLEGFDLSLRGDTVTGTIGRIEATKLNVGPIQATAVTLPIDAISFTPGMVRPSGSLRITRAAVGAFNAANEIRGQDITVALLEVDVQSKSTAQFKGIEVGKLALPDGDVGAVRADGSIAYGLTSGTFEGAVRTAQGSVVADGTLRLSPFTKKFRASFSLAFDAVSGAIAANVLKNLPAAQRASLSPPLNGTLEVSTTIARKTPAGESKKRWLATTQIEAVELTGRSRWRFDGDAWTEVTTPLDGPSDGGTPSP